eukprot:scaffold5341_cov125-Skeletonema_dohrnii-CCMP3373.AAC.4
MRTSAKIRSSPRSGILCILLIVEDARTFQIVGSSPTNTKPETQQTDAKVTSYISSSITSTTTEE